MLRDFLWVGIGGAAGSIARYAATLAVQKIWMKPFPLATLLINTAGCLLIGLLYGFSQRNQWPQHNTIWLLLATGLCGGFTTFSAFALENTQLLQNNLSFTSIAYILFSVVGGILCCFLGAFLVGKL